MTGRRFAITQLAREIAVAALALLLLAVSSTSGAVEVRRGEPAVTITAGEVIDDTLIVLGERLTVDGTVNGDLVALVREIVVRGTVAGDVIGAAETVTVEGTVGGNVIGFGATVTLPAGRVAGNLYAFGRDVSLGRGAAIDGNATAFGASIDVAGDVGVDLLGFAREVALSGRVGRNVEAAARTVTVHPGATVGGNLVARVPRDEDLRGAERATVQGDVDVSIAERRARPSRYLTASFYVRQALRLAAAFVAGLLLLWLVPRLRDVSIGFGDTLKAGGLGLVAAVTLPVASLLAIITIIGIPLGLAGLLLWAIVLYFGKIVVAQQIGRVLFASPQGLPHYAVTLIAGLVIVMIAVNLPYVGWLANVLLTLLGVGSIALSAMAPAEAPRRA